MLPQKNSMKEVKNHTLDIQYKILYCIILARESSATKTIMNYKQSKQFS